MKYLVAVALGWWLLGCNGAAQDSPKHVTMIQLMGAPDKFDGQRVTVWGFLRIHRQPKHGVSVVLYLHREDSDNLLGNSILVIPNKQMLKDEEKIDHMYVILTGTFRAVQAAGGGYVLEIKDVKSCAVWSDPQRPIGSRSVERKRN